MLRQPNILRLALGPRNPGAPTPLAWRAAGAGSRPRLGDWAPHGPLIDPG